MQMRTGADDQRVIRAAVDRDAAALAAIYNHYVTDTIITFEEVPISGAEMWRRVNAVRDAALPWLVAESGGVVVGYAYASKWKDRIGYRFSVETSVYLDATCCGKGHGTALYRELFALLQQCGAQAVMGGIALPNTASVALHEAFGMRKVAHFERVGFKFGAWIDVAYWQRLLGMPSANGGTDMTAQ